MNITQRECDCQPCLRKERGGSRKIRFWEAYHEGCEKACGEVINKCVEEHINYAQQAGKGKIDLEQIKKALTHIEEGIDTELAIDKSLQDKSSTMFIAQGIFLSFAVFLSTRKGLDIFSFLNYLLFVFSIFGLWFGNRVIKPKSFTGKGTGAQGWLNLDYLEKTDENLETSLNLQILGNYAKAEHENSLRLKTNRFYIDWQVRFFMGSLLLLLLLVIFYTIVEAQ